MKRNPELKAFWDETAKRFGKMGYKAVLNPTSRGILNWYTDYFHQRSLMSIIEKLTHKKVLEIGCGVGRWSSRLVQVGSEVVGFDVSRKMLKEAKQNIIHKFGLPSIDLINGTADRLPFSNESFDVVLSVTVLQHIVNKEQLEEIVQEIIRILKINGKIILLELAPKKEKPVFLSFPTIYNSPETWIRLFTVEKPMILVEQHGVSLSLFLKPFEWVLKRFSKYSDKLFNRWKQSLGYNILNFFFYFCFSLAIITSIPFDLIFTNHLTSYSNSKVFSFKKRESCKTKHCKR